MALIEAHYPPHHHGGTHDAPNHIPEILPQPHAPERDRAAPGDCQRCAEAEGEGNSLIIMALDKRQQQITCRACGMQHRAPVCCPTCKSIVPAYAIFKGSRKMGIVSK